MIIVASGDTLTPEYLAEEAFDHIQAPERLLHLTGGHFSRYVADFEVTARVTAEWFAVSLSKSSKIG